MGCTAGTWLINGYDSILGLYARNICLRGYKDVPTTDLILSHGHKGSLLVSIMSRHRNILKICLKRCIFHLTISLISVFSTSTDFSIFFPLFCSSMHLSLGHDTSTSLSPPFRLGATRVMHLHGFRGERHEQPEGPTRGTAVLRLYKVHHTHTHTQTSHRRMLLFDHLHDFYECCVT